MKKDLTKGPVFQTLVLYSIPLIVTNLVSILFHAADVTVLSLMSGDAAVAIVCYLFLVRGTFRRLKEAFAKEEAPIAAKL